MKVKQTFLWAVIALAALVLNLAGCKSNDPSSGDKAAENFFVGHEWADTMSSDVLSVSRNSNGSLQVDLDKINFDSRIKEDSVVVFSNKIGGYTLQLYIKSSLIESPDAMALCCQWQCASDKVLYLVYSYYEERYNDMHYGKWNQIK